MPHSGGGGSHGGGSHGGSHGSHGSSSRTSRTYFPGARRYRRHYNDGRPDEYFYTNGRPQKTNLFSIIFLMIFGGIFTVGTFAAMKGSMPKRLNEHYRRPSTHVIDNIDVIDDEDELDEILDDMNDITGICPVVYTMYTEDYDDHYADLESFAYDCYVDEWSDEQHYLVVYAIPEYQAEDVRSGALEVPDYEFEVMMGDDTDAIISEGIEESFVNDLYSRFEDGEDVDEAFIGAFTKLSDRTESRLNSKGIKLSSLFPLAVIGLIFVFPIVVLIKSYIKDRGVEFEEVPLADEDRAYVSSIGDQRVQAVSDAVTSKGAMTAVKVFLYLFMTPFVLVGFTQIIGGIAALVSGKGSPAGVFQLVFGLIWLSITIASIFGISKGLKMAQKSKSSPMTADYPKAEMPHADYPQADYPQQDYGPVSHDSCHSPHDEDEDSVRKGYE